MILYFILINYIFSINVFELNFEKFQNTTVKIDTLYDKSNGNIYFIDKSRTVITASDKNGKIIWKTNPYKDAFLPKYRYVRTYIVYFELGNKENKEVIFISYHNSMSGFLVKATGKFYWTGND